MSRICLDCGRIIPTGTRCEPHRLAHERARRPSTTQRGYGAAWQRYSRQRIAMVGRCQGWEGPCPYPDAGTQANPLTTDHATLGLVLCRRCNSSKQHADAGVRRNLGIVGRR